MAWYLNPALTRFRNEVNARWPGRDKASDGTIGDAAHQATSSDHNPDGDGSVDAWDMDNNGVDVNAVIAAAVKHEATAYVIWNRRITSRNMSGGLGVWHPYNGASPHTEHVHFNTRSSHENSTKPWFTSTAQPAPLEDDMALDAADKSFITATVNAKTWGYPFATDASMLTKMGALFATVDLLATAALDDDADREALKAQLAAVNASVGQVDEAVLTGLGSVATPEEQADLLRAVLGDRAQEVGALLAAG